MKKRSVILMIVLLTVVLVGIPMALSISSYLNPLQSVYGSGSCTTCHSSSSGGSRNDYGTLFENQPNHNTDPISALQAIGAPPGVTPLPTPTVTATPVPPSVNTIRFVTIGDTHITSDATTDQYQRLTKAVNYINSRTDIDFVVELGDVADSATSANFASAKSILDGLNKPYYVIEGNHDLGSDGTLFTQYFGPSEHVENINSYQLIFVGLQDIGSTLYWAFDYNTVDRSKPTIIFSHGPVQRDPTISGSTCDSSWGDTLHRYACSMRPETDKFTDLLGFYDGHVHVETTQTIGGTLYVTQDNLGGNGPASDFIGYTVVQGGILSYELINYNNASIPTVPPDTPVPPISSIGGPIISCYVIKAGSVGPVPTISPTPGPTTVPTSGPTVSPTPGPTTVPGALTDPSLGVFYYPWTGGSSENPASDNWRHWKDNGHNPPSTWFGNYLPDYTSSFDPSTELYSSKDTKIIKEQLGLMRRAGIGFVISSWWGQNSFEDQALDIIFNQVLSSSDNPYPDVKFAIYYEKEGFADVPISEIESDINYIKNKYANSPYYLKINEMPVVFVYNADSGGLADAQKWKQVKDDTGIYTVLKVFSGYDSNAGLADSWHQYAPTTSYESQGTYSAFVSPGYHKGDEAVRLERENFVRFENDVVALKNANVQFRLIETWNEWGEGTGIEPAQKINHDDINGFTEAAPSYGTGYIDILGKYFTH